MRECFGGRPQKPAPWEGPHTWSSPSPPPPSGENAELARAARVAVAELGPACWSVPWDTPRPHLTKAHANEGDGDLPGLPPRARHRPSPSPRNTSTSWNSEPSSQLSAFTAHTRLSWLEETVLPHALQARENGHCRGATPHLVRFCPQPRQEGRKSIFLSDGARSKRDVLAAYKAPY